VVNETRWSLAWAERPAEQARVFNPAFCGELIGRSVCEYHRRRQEALSIATAFAILPLTLHRPTREALPGLASTAFAGWVADNGALLADLPERVKRLRPVTREGLLFALRHQLLGLESGGLVPGARPVRLSARFSVSTDEVNDARRASGLLGRWFARQGTQTSILQGMGIAP
jgi:hypothetical protein